MESVESADGRRVTRARRALAGRLILPAILLTALALRLYRLGDKNIWWDEGFSLGLARQGLAAATLASASDVHPPLYYWNLWTWVRFAGDGEFAGRFLSAGWGVLAVAVAYCLGVRLGGRRAGLLGALFLALSRFHIWWSQEMRMYVLAALVATLTLYAAVRWLEEEREGQDSRQGQGSHRAWLLGYVLAAAASLYTIYVAGLVPLVANGYALLALARLPAQRRWGAVLRWLAAQCAVLLLLVPWLLLALPRIQTWSTAEPFSFRLFLKLYAVLLSLGMSTEIERYTPFLVPFVAVLLAGLGTLRWRRRDSGLPAGQVVSLFVLALALLPLAVFILTRVPHVFYTPRVEARYLLLFAPLFYLFLGWSAARLSVRSRPLALLALAVTIGPMLAFLPEHYADRYLRDEAQTMVHILRACARPDDAVILISGDRYPIFGYYYERMIPPERRVPVVRLPRTQRFTSDNVAEQLEGAIGGRSRFWVAAFEARIQDPSLASLTWLDAHYPRAFTHDMGHNALILYGDVPEPLLVERARLQPQRPLQVQAGGLEVLGYDLPVLEYRPGDVVDLGIYHAGEARARIQLDWVRGSGEVLESVSEEWPATGAAARRAGIRFRVWPWYPPGDTYFVLRWPGTEGTAEALRLSGPRILPIPEPVQPGRIAQPLDVRLGDGVRLRGFDLHRAVRDGLAEARAGEELTLDLFWEATGPIGQDYTVFTQLVGSSHNPDTGGPVWAQHDGQPVGGEYPTGRWRPGVIVADRHVLKIDGDAPAGDYELVAGMYLLATLERLPVQGADGAPGGDHVTLLRVRVRR
ncbi:MAG: glycosyltransferase family 39 protein [Anaerolineae bacterium]|nr:glycosyltransferase family 39 protein [Anaerolineae bacterium]